VAPNEAANNTLISGAAIGTLAGAALGAAIGAASGHAGAGAAVGAGSGLVAGTAIASGPAYATGWELQRRYDIAYQQCMYANGNQISGYGRPSRRAIPPPPPNPH
jgi:outer membrane lipoprotein SlyB